MSEADYEYVEDVCVECPVCGERVDFSHCPPQAPQCRYCGWVRVTKAKGEATDEHPSYEN